MSLREIGAFHLPDEARENTLRDLKAQCGLNELMYLSTCNRVEFIFTTDKIVDAGFCENFFRVFPGENKKELLPLVQVFSGEETLQHLFSVAASLDSLVVGEREIITQVRKAFEESNRFGLTGDTLRLVVKKTIETAKRVYTETNIAKNPVSVVSLAYRKLRSLHVPLDARFIFVGAGMTNTAMARYLFKHGYRDFSVFNRTLAHAEKLSAEINGNAFALDALAKHTKGFDVIVTCTGASEAVITPEIYQAIAGSDTARKIVIDLAVPNDLDPRVLQQWDVKLIAVSNLQEVANENLKQREKELQSCTVIIENGIAEFKQEIRLRHIELAMSEVPKKIKEIRDTAVNAVFAKEISELDENSKELLDRVLNYVEKKYISVPMKMAREILTDEVKQH